ncbi:MAG: hypothetical protein LBV12_04640 [Puniceicoccales bacterium]|jgi:DNA-binding NarL/FixJ family response regulator|nr:hypothetical protein [Puniceicoccales bacterium]
MEPTINSVRKILVVGSDISPCREVAVELEGVGYQCEKISFGENILSALDVYAPDALIVGIPVELSGDKHAMEGVFSLLLAARLQCANLPVMVAGSSKSGNLSRRTQELGMLGFIGETFQVAVLDELLSSAIDQKRAIDLRVIQSNNLKKRGSRYPWALRMEAVI